MHIETEGMGGGRLALEFDPALIVGGEAEAPGLAPASGKAGLGLQLLVQVDRVAENLRDRRRGTELADEAGGVPGRTAGQLAAVDEDHVGLVVAGKMVGGGAADDAAADDNDFGVRLQAGGHASILARSFSAKARAKRSM